MAKKKAMFPKRIYVTKEADQNDPSNSYLVADETTDSVEDGAQVGVYELVETRTMRVTKELD